MCSSFRAPCSSCTGHWTSLFPITSVSHVYVCVCVCACVSTCLVFQRTHTHSLSPLRGCAHVFPPLGHCVVPSGVFMLQARSCLRLPCHLDTTSTCPMFVFRTSFPCCSAHPLHSFTPSLLHSCPPSLTFCCLLRSLRFSTQRTVGCTISRRCGNASQHTFALEWN